jgi:PadR family transcriptional regulator PadR
VPNDQELDNDRHELRRGKIVLVCWCAGVLVCWCAGVLVCWCAGVLLRAPNYGYALLTSRESLGLAVDADTRYPLPRRLDKQSLLDGQWNADESRLRKFYVTSGAALFAAGLVFAQILDAVDAVDAVAGTDGTLIGPIQT